MAAIVKGTSASDIIDDKDGVTNGVDYIYGLSGNDLIFGLGGDDIITGGLGADAIYGGSGNDTANYIDSATGVAVNLASGSGAGGTAQGDTLFSIENLYGSSYGDLLIGDDGANTLVGWNGNDILIGGEGADLLLGLDDDDTLKGGGGADILDGGLGFDTMMGGAGDDIYYAYGDESISEAAGEGYDVVYASTYAFTLPDNLETLVLAGTYGTGNSQSNTIYGDATDNILNGAAGADSLVGMGGNDSFVFQKGEANGDYVYDFDGNGYGAGDFMYFVGYGTIAEGATFHQISATTWEIASADGQVHDYVTFVGAPTITANDFVFV